MRYHSHSTALPPATIDLIQSCPVFSFFLILFARRDILHSQPGIPSSPLLPNHCVNCGDDSESSFCITSTNFSFLNLKSLPMDFHCSFFFKLVSGVYLEVAGIMKLHC